MPNVVALESLNDAVGAFTDDDYQESKKQEDEKAEKVCVFFLYYVGNAEITPFLEL